MDGWRWRFWSTLTVLALLWTCGAPMLTVAQYLSHTPKIDSSSSVFYAVSNVLCIGLPATGICAFLGYRNSSFGRKQKRNKEKRIARESENDRQEWQAIARSRRAEHQATTDSTRNLLS
jgi:hypothetical protein